LHSGFQRGLGIVPRKTQTPMARRLRMKRLPKIFQGNLYA
jgi:hypothetical protein